MDTCVETCISDNTTSSLLQIIVCQCHWLEVLHVSPWLKWHFRGSGDLWAVAACIQGPFSSAQCLTSANIQLCIDEILITHLGVQVGLHYRKHKNSPLVVTWRRNNQQSFTMTCRNNTNLHIIHRFSNFTLCVSAVSQCFTWNYFQTWWNWIFHWNCIFKVYSVRNISWKAFRFVLNWQFHWFKFRFLNLSSLCTPFSLSDKDCAEPLSCGPDRP